MLPITVRLLTLTDLPAYKALRDEALRNSPEAFTSDYATEVQKPASAYACRLYAAASGHFLLGAFDAQEQSLGSIALEVEARLQKKHCATVTAMVVNPAAQDQGIAMQLIAACTQRALTMPHLCQLVLTVTASNTHAVRLYERAGFTCWGLLPKSIKVNGLYYDKLYMRLDLALLRANPLRFWCTGIFFASRYK